MRFKEYISKLQGSYAQQVELCGQTPPEGGENTGEEGEEEPPILS